MINKLIKYIEKENLFNKDDKILLAISGGKDSVCMFNLFLNLNYDFSIAHCNFQLRGHESDNDQLFVENIANNHSIKFFSKKFNTAEYAKKNNLSIQMAARKQRYDWFLQLGFDKILTAHHIDDSIETLILKKNKKSSLGALRGIPLKNKNIIRPMLCFYEKEINDYMISNNIQWRDDSSNKLIKYERNNIRLNVLPKMEKNNSNIKEELLLEIEKNKIRYSNLLLEVKKIKDKSWIKYDSHKELLLNDLLTYENKEELLYELLKSYGPFNWRDIFNLASTSTGKKIENQKYIIIKNRGSFLISEKSNTSDEVFFIDENILSITKPISLTFSVVNSLSNQCLKNSKNSTLDYNKLVFPLVLRKWKNGDSFIPLGMKGYKKVSDYMIDEKMSLLQKQNTWVLCSNDDIVSVIGNRIDDRYKLGHQTEKIYLVQPI